MENVLEREIAYYNEHRDELIEKHLGRFVLVKDESLIGVFNTIEQAISEGARRYGLSSFLVREVTRETEKEVFIPALSLGILNADSTRPV